MDQNSEIKHKIGIIGCGLIGNKRAEALQKFTNSKIVMVSDIDKERASQLAEKHSCKYTTNWKKITRNPEINLVIISTINDVLTKITLDAIKNNKNVLVEKPVGRNPKEVKKIIEEYEKDGKNKKIKIKVGFNHRFHPAFDKAKEIITKENIGEIMFIRARYGHGARVGYNKEWRANKKIAGGGEMLDQGCHIVDLSRYFIGNFDSSIGYCTNSFWEMEVEDNCFAILKNKKNQVAFLHASCTQWKNIFSMEIFCKTGQINIDGLVKSYGAPKLTFYKMKPEMGPPETFVYEWENIDNSWEKEYANMIESIENNIEPNGNIYDAYESIKIVFDIYKWNKKNNKN